MTLIHLATSLHGPRNQGHAQVFLTQADNLILRDSDLASNFSISVYTDQEPGPHPLNLNTTNGQSHRVGYWL
ncbi:hypothetical protein RRG08_006621 [Elysia crispata]|uniref:Uncharacterized protein n=1 Tax=Elysia crispata TaxID=231223 RepID=A0AAE1D5G5_9GAST|nr:hypothetical protein RRG08_006621 [Elysia crispata]